MDLQGILKLGVNNQNQSGDKLHKDRMLQACKEFESLFITYLLKSMRQTVPRSGYLHDSSNLTLQEDFYVSAMDEEIARNVAGGRGIGLAAALYRQFSQNKNT